MCVTASAIVLLVEPFTALLGSAFRDAISRNPGLVPPIVNAVAIVVLLFWVRTPPYLGVLSSLPNSAAAAMRFFQAWRLVWWMWLLFYAYLILEALLFEESRMALLPDPGWASVMRNLLNNVHTACIVSCYFLLAWPIVAAVDPTKAEPDHLVIPLVALVLSAACLEVLFAGLWPLQRPLISMYAEVLSALAAGIAVAMLASRLSGLYADRVPLGMALLFVYALVQMGYVAFPNHPILKQVVLWSVLPLKVWLFVFVRWAMMSGKLTFYYRESLEFHQRVRSDWEAFRAGTLKEVQLGEP